MENDNLEPDYFDGVIDVRRTKAKELVESVLKVGQVHSKDAQPSNDWVHVSTIAPVIEQLQNRIKHLEQEAERHADFVSHDPEIAKKYIKRETGISDKELDERVERAAKKINNLLQDLSKCSACGRTEIERAEMKFPCVISACPY